MGLVHIAPMSCLLILVLIAALGFGSKPRKHKSKKTLRCICVVWGIGTNLEYHINLEGWNSFLILSCLSVFTTRVDAHVEQNLKELQLMLEKMTPLFKVSNASLYTPSPDVLHGCTKKLMYCYLLELNVILHEENGTEDDLSLTHRLINLYRTLSSCSFCSACETHPRVNATTFCERLNTFVFQLSSVDLNDEDNCA